MASVVYEPNKKVQQIGGTRMGRGDRRTKRGKIWRGTHGNTRPKKKKVTEKNSAQS
jgi:30S ribosomal protein S31